MRSVFTYVPANDYCLVCGSSQIPCMNVYLPPRSQLRSSGVYTAASAWVGGDKLNYERGLQYYNARQQEDMHI